MKIGLLSVCLFTVLFTASASAQSVSKKLLAQDLVYTVKTVSEVHPALVNERVRKKLEARSVALVQALPDEVPRWRVGVTIAELLRVLNDAHTSTDLTFGSSSYLSLQFAWLSDGLVVAPVTGSKVAVPVASEVLKIGDLDTRALERKLAELIPENRYAVRESVRDLPTEGILRWLGVVQDDAVTLTLRTPSGKVKTVKVELTSDELGLSQALEELLLKARGLSGPWQGNADLAVYRVEAEYGFLWLPTCKNTAEYRFWVDRFFHAATEAGVKSVVISVQQNGGGNSSVMYHLLSHLPKESFRSFSVSTRYSFAALQALGFTQAQFDEAVQKHQVGGVALGEDVYNWVSKNEVVPKKAPVFFGKVYVFINSASFSAAVDTATVLSDNHVATLVGEPTGGTPTSYGDLLRFTTPFLSIPLTVSYKYFVRPDPNRDPADTLTPDIPLPVTVKDVQTGHSPVTGWLKDLAQNP